MVIILFHTLHDNNLDTQFSVVFAFVLMTYTSEK